MPSHNGHPDTAFGQANSLGFRHDETISELNPHGPLPRCLRFAPTSRPVNGKTRYRPVRYDANRVGLAPTGFHSKVSLAHGEILLCQAFPGAVASISTEVRGLTDSDYRVGPATTDPHLRCPLSLTEGRRAAPMGYPRRHGLTLRIAGSDRSIGHPQVGLASTGLLGRRPDLHCWNGHSCLFGGGIPNAVVYSLCELQS